MRYIPGIITRANYIVEGMPVDDSIVDFKHPVIKPIFREHFPSGASMASKLYTGRYEEMTAEMQFNEPVALLFERWGYGDSEPLSINVLGAGKAGGNSGIMLQFWALYKGRVQETDVGTWKGNEDINFKINLHIEEITLRINSKEVFYTDGVEVRENGRSMLADVNAAILNF